jgi:hypothetical protein
VILLLFLHLWAGGSAQGCCTRFSRQVLDAREREKKREAKEGSSQWWKKLPVGVSLWKEEKSGENLKGARRIKFHRKRVGVEIIAVLFKGSRDEENGSVGTVVLERGNWLDDFRICCIGSVIMA